MRPADLIYAVDEIPPVPQLLLLALQYAAMISIYLVLVVIVLRHADISDEARLNVVGMALMAAAIGTVLQGLPRGPVGSGFLAPPVYSAIYLAPSILAAEKGGLPLVFGMTVFSGLVVVLFGLLFYRLRVIFTQVISGLTVFLVGIELGVVGIGELLDVRHETSATFHLHVAVSILTLAVAIALSVWGRGTVRMLCSLVGLGVGLCGAGVIGLIGADATALVHAASWIMVPLPDFSFYRFDPALIPAFLAAGIAAAVRTVGVVTTCQRMNDPDWRHPDTQNIRKGVLADGTACVIGGILGAPGMNISPSLVGLSSATGATSRAIGFAAALILLVIAISPKAAAVFLMIPSEVAGGILVFTASFMITSGMGIILSRPLHTPAIYVVGLSTLFALSRTIFPDFFESLPAVIETMTGSPLAVGLSVAIGLSLVFLIGTRQRAETVWSAATGSMAPTIEFLRAQASRWEVGRETTELCEKDMEQLLENIRMNDQGPQRGRLTAVFNGVDLRLDVSFSGKRPKDLSLVRRVADFRVELLDNEEAAAHIGLRDFLHSIATDRKRVVHRRKRTIIRLWYAV